MEHQIIYTIGHSNHSAERLVELLRQYGIELVVDVRSSPYSRFNPQFNKENIEGFLEESGIDYAFYGNSLGGRPNDPGCCDENEIIYARIREKDWFQDGLDSVCWEGKNRVVALLCSEEDPNKCHRQHLLTQELLGKGVRLGHIRGNGKLEEGAENQEQFRLL